MYEKNDIVKNFPASLTKKKSTSAPQSFLPAALQVRFVRQIMANTTIESGNRKKETA